jgi:hypothetical protein
MKIIEATSNADLLRIGTSVIYSFWDKGSKSSLVQGVIAVPPKHLLTLQVAVRDLARVFNLMRP